MIHLGLKNTGFEYTMVTERNERIELKSSRLENNFGVYMSHDMKSASHIEEVVSKANRYLGVIRSSFKNLTLLLLNFSIVLWSNHT